MASRSISAYRLRSKRIYAILALLLGITVSLALIRTASLGINILMPSHVAQLAAAVGVSVGVEPNPYNSLAEQLNQKEEALTLREKRLREAENAQAATTQRKDRTLQYLLGLTSFLVFLIILNFVLDWRMSRIRYSNA